VIANDLSTLPMIYDSAINADIWGDTLERGAANIGAKGALLLIIDQRPEGAFQINHFSNIWSLAPERAAMYNEKYSHYEKPVWDKLFSSPKQSLILDTEFWKDEPDLLERPDYRYLKNNVGIVHKCAARLNDNLSWWDTLVVHFDEKYSAIPASSVQSIRAMVPHVAKSVELGRSFEILKSQYRAVLSALDYVQIGLCIALEDGTIIVRNEEADRILSANDGIKLDKNKKLNCKNTEKNAALGHAIKSTGMTANGTSALPEAIFSIARPSGLKSLLIEVAPLRDYDRELESNLHGALVSIIDPENSAPFSAKKVAIAYKLSAAESEVCALLVEGLSNLDIADIRNVSPETIKSQVKSIFSKTNCQRRSDLIRLVLKTTPAIIGRTTNGHQQ